MVHFPEIKKEIESLLESDLERDQKSLKITQLISKIPLDVTTLFDSVPMKEDLIVRSSARLEDQMKSAAAGIFSSREIKEVSELKKAILDVISSAFSERALAFFSKETHASLFDMTLIIQNYISDGQYSGVGFSVADEKKWDLAGLQIKGLGGGVDGTEIPTYLLINTSNQTFDDLRLGRNEELPCEVAVAKELSLLLKELERSFNAPVEIEFVGKGNEVSIVQVRPITLL